MHSPKISMELRKPPCKDYFLFQTGEGVSEYDPYTVLKGGPLECIFCIHSQEAYFKRCRVPTMQPPWIKGSGFRSSFHSTLNPKAKPSFHFLLHAVIVRTTCPRTGHRVGSLLVRFSIEGRVFPMALPLQGCRAIPPTEKSLDPKR